MLIVEVQKGNVTRALKILSRRVKLTKQLVKLRKSRYYTKKSEQKSFETKKHWHPPSSTSFMCHERKQHSKYIVPLVVDKKGDQDN